MGTLPTTLTKNRIWQTTLESQDQDQFASERERLRSCFLAFRERAAHLAGETRRDLPDLTFYDVILIDALWKITSIITGAKYTFSPTEAFVLGGAFLLHDLVMSVAATEGGLGAIYKRSALDAISCILNIVRPMIATRPSRELRNPEVRIQGDDFVSLLGQIHAENAEKLCVHVISRERWRSPLPN